MNEPNSTNEKPKDQRRYDPELLKKGLRCDLDQYEILKRCSDKKDMTEWNQWRKEHRDEEILLEGVKFARANLEGANFRNAYLEKANFSLAHLEGSFFHGALLQGANLKNAHLENAVFWHADLRGVNVKTAIVNGSTSFWGCRINRYCKDNGFTDFRGVSLNVVLIDPGTKQLLEYNIRRRNWEQWYETRVWWWRTSVKYFWTLSDYGTSTIPIMKSFFLLAMVFAMIYYCFGVIDYYALDIKNEPGIVYNLFEDEHGLIGWWLVPLRSIYFSIVTMTTLGFGDIYANPHSYWWGWLGHFLLMVQVILGYVLLGALVTRFAVLFTAGGPAGTFADDKKQKTDDREKRTG